MYLYGSKLGVFKIVVLYFNTIKIRILHPILCFLYEFFGLTSLDEGHGGKGIDLVTDKVGSKPYDVIEVKFNTAKQKGTNDGLQGCRKWTMKRLEAAVGYDKAKEIDENFRVILANVDKSGNITYYLLDDKGKKIGLATF